jgi:hypothetical protein
MAGNYKGPGHKIVSGETPEVGLRVMSNEYKWGTITKVDDPEGHKTCGWYCEAWHEVRYDDGGGGSFNCDRLTTKEPR